MSADIDRRFRPDTVAKTILPDITANFYFWKMDVSKDYWEESYLF